MAFPFSTVRRRFWPGRRSTRHRVELSEVAVGVIWPSLMLQFRW
jgi:hypothetical protein